MCEGYSITRRFFPVAVSHELLLPEHLDLTLDYECDLAKREAG